MAMEPMQLNMPNFDAEDIRRLYRTLKKADIPVLSIAQISDGHWQFNFEPDTEANRTLVLTALKAFDLADAREVEAAEQAAIAAQIEAVVNPDTALNEINADLKKVQAWGIPPEITEVIMHILMRERALLNGNKHLWKGIRK